MTEIRITRKRGNRNMKIVLVEDRPWKLEKSIIEIRRRGVVLCDLVYVRMNKDVPDKLAEEKLQKLKATVEDLTIHTVDNENFSEVLKGFSENPQYFILCDFNLTGDKREYFDKRVNVIFANQIAKHKNGKIQPSPCIYFYTTAGKTTNEQINVAFPERNIPVIKMDNGQVILDFAKVADAVRKFEE